jgi:molecular chaperone GrpE
MEPLEEETEDTVLAVEVEGEEAPELDAQAMLVPAERLVAVEGERDEYRDQLLRARAEFDNFRKRTARDSEQLRKTAAQSLVLDLLPVVDNLERALDHIEDREHPLAQGMDMVKKQFADALARHGVAPIQALGQVFDPNLHEALSHQPSGEFAADVVAVEYQRGYTIGGQVLRPAKVVVSSGPSPSDGAAEDTEKLTES